MLYNDILFLKFILYINRTKFAFISYGGKQCIVGNVACLPDKTPDKLDVSQSHDNITSAVVLYFLTIKSNKMLD